MPAMRVYFPSVAPVDMVGTRGTPGQVLLRVFSMAAVRKNSEQYLAGSQVLLRVFSMAAVSSGSSGEGGTGTAGTTFPSGSVCFTMLILTLGSLATCSSVLRTPCGSSPGKMRQLTLARAVCGSALGAWPPEI